MELIVGQEKEDRRVVPAGPCRPEILRQSRPKDL